MTKYSTTLQNNPEWKGGSQLTRAQDKDVLRLKNFYKKGSN